jgi:hypothetical protein
MSDIDELSLLMSEKENADARISGYYQLQATILGLALSGIVGVLGFVFTKDGLQDGPALTYILLALVAIASIAGLQATIFNGFALGYICYKQEILGCRFQELLSLQKNPLLTASDINRSPGALCNAVFGTSKGPAPSVAPLIAGFIGSGALFGSSIIAAIQFGKALDEVRNGQTQC